MNHVFLLKSRNVKFNFTRRYISTLELENTNTKTRLKNRLNILLQTICASYTHFSDDYILIFTTICNFRCLYNILYNLEEHCVLLTSFRYIFVYIFWWLQTILDVYLEIYSCFSKMQNNQRK